MTISRPQPHRGPRLRALILVVGGLESVLVAAFVVLMLQSSDPLGKAIGRGMATLVAIPYGVLVIPALVMAFVNRWLPLALMLIVLAVPVTLYVWSRA